MFNISMEKDPAHSLLYILVACAGLILSALHYWFGQFNLVLSSLIINTIFLLSAFFLFLNRNKKISKYVNILAFTTIAVVIQYQLHIQASPSLYWVMSFPAFSFMVLPIYWAVMINTSIIISSSILFYSSFDLIEATRQILMIFTISLCAFCYAVANQAKRSNLLKLAVTDYQSGAYNYPYLKTKLHQEVARSNVTNRTLSLLAVTIEDHNQVIEIHGKDVGDALLQEFKDVIYQMLRAGDEVFHDGEGTFYILLPNCPIEGATVLRERLMKKLEQYPWTEVGELHLNTGFATLNFNESADTFLQRASEHVSKQQQTALRLLAFDNQ